MEVLAAQLSRIRGSEGVWKGLQRVLCFSCGFFHAERLLEFLRVFFFGLGRFGSVLLI